MPSGWRRWWTRRCAHQPSHSPAVTTGPGTFTGQRVGLAFMRGLRLALKIPLAGITTLEAMAAAAIAETGLVRAAAIHDARRDEAYLFLTEGAQIVQEPVVLGFHAALDHVHAFGPCVLAGTGAKAAAAATGYTLSGIRQPDALWVARLAQIRPTTTEVPGPLYLRAPDAKLPKTTANAGSSLTEVLLVDPESDLTTLAALHAACFARPWNARALHDLLTSGAFGLYHRDGFVLSRAAGGEAEILTLAVAPYARGKGLGRALLQAAIKEAGRRGAQSLFLEVGADNPSALALYAGLGFAKVGMRKGYYASDSGDKDALVLRLPLTGDFA